MANKYSLACEAKIKVKEWGITPNSDHWLHYDELHANAMIMYSVNNKLVYIELVRVV